MAERGEPKHRVKNEDPKYHDFALWDSPRSAIYNENKMEN